MSNPREFARVPSESSPAGTRIGATEPTTWQNAYLSSPGRSGSLSNRPVNVQTRKSWATNGLSTFFKPQLIQVKNRKIAGHRTSKCLYCLPQAAPRDGCVGPSIHRANIPCFSGDGYEEVCAFPLDIHDHLGLRRGQTAPPSHLSQSNGRLQLPGR